MTVLTHRFAQAVEYARIAHASQVRKGSNIPYIYHLLGVASLVLAHKGNEDQAIAGLLHDVLEDCGAEHEPRIRAKFGDIVADIVLDCTDGTAEGKAKHLDTEARRRDWQVRKIAYLAHVRQESEGALLVSACDKLHNASAIVEDLEAPEVGHAVFDRFTATREQTLGFYQALSEIFTTRRSPVSRAFDAMVGRMHALAGDAPRRALEPEEDGLVLDGERRSTLDPALIQAFRETRYEIIKGEQLVVLQIGQSNREAAQLLADVGAQSAAFLTAANPLSRELAAQENAQRNAALSKEALEIGALVWPGVGRSPDGAWTEESLLIVGASRDQANRLADQYEQNAYVWVDADGTASLVLRR